MLPGDRSQDWIARNQRDVAADAQEVVLHWDEANYHLNVVPSDSSEAAQLRVEMERLRDEYARLIEEARKNARDYPEASALAADLRPWGTCDA